MKFLTAAVALLLPFASHACISVAGRDPEVDLLSRGRVLLDTLRHALQENLKDRKAPSHYGPARTKEETRQIEAIDVIYRGDYQRALTLLLELERDSPGRYDTAFNIGTVYELLGENENATNWIKEGIKRNPGSLAGTEWLHVAILDAKIEAAKHPEKELRRHQLEIPAELNSDSEIRIAGRTYFASSVSEALFHQLHERMEFVKPTDPYVADLLYSYALLEGRLSSYHRMLPLENALGLLDLARKYGLPSDSLQSQSEPIYWAVRLWLVRAAVWGIPALLVILLPFWLAVKTRDPESWMYWAWQRLKPTNVSQIATGKNT